MKCLVSLHSLVRRCPFAAVCALATLGALSWMTMRSQAQLDWRNNIVLVIFDGDLEVGRVFRDHAGAKYTEHWVLFPNYTFDGKARPGESIRIEAEPGPGYKNVTDFLDNVPFPEGSRYVVARCREFRELPVDD